MKRTRITLLSLLVLILSPFLYLAAWCLIYRIPPSPPVVADLRSSPAAEPYYVVFCSSLADNPFGGYPGHGYVLWSTTTPITDYRQTRSFGFVPAAAQYQIPSLVTRVPGLMVTNAWQGNSANFTSLTAIVDKAHYDSSYAVAKSWQSSFFQVGIRDCVTFTNDIAHSLGLRTPKPNYKYPQDYIRELKLLNGE